MKVTSVFAVGVLAALAGCRASTDKPVVIVYGDSLTVSAEGALSYLYGDRYQFVFRAGNGTAPCDWVAGMAADRELFQPSEAIFAFTGNVATPCIKPYWDNYGSFGARENYELALRQFAAVYHGLGMTVVGAPAMHNISWYYFNGDPMLNAMYQSVSAQLGLHYTSAADQDLTPGHVFRWSGPQFPTGPTVTYRVADGIHLTPAGQVWYATALMSESAG